MTFPVWSFFTKLKLWFVGEKKVQIPRILLACRRVFGPEISQVHLRLPLLGIMEDVMFPLKLKDTEEIFK